MEQATVDRVSSCGLLFTAQPEAPASVPAGDFGWAVNDELNSLQAVLGVPEKLYSQKDQRTD